MRLVQRGNRLSILPVAAIEWRHILKMAGRVMNVFGRFAITLRLKVMLLAIGVFPLICASALADQHQGDKVMVEMTTSKGVIELELDAKNAPDYGGQFSRVC